LVIPGHSTILDAGARPVAIEVQIDRRRLLVASNQGEDIYVEARTILIHVGKYWSKRASRGHQHLELVEPRWSIHLRASTAVPGLVVKACSLLFGVAGLSAVVNERRRKLLNGLLRVNTLDLQF